MEQNAHRLEYVDKAGLYLMQKCEPPNCVQTQKELDEFHALLNAVLAKLISNGEKAASLAKGGVSRSKVSVSVELYHHFGCGNLCEFLVELYRLILILMIIVIEVLSSVSPFIVVFYISLSAQNFS